MPARKRAREKQTAPAAETLLGAIQPVSQITTVDTDQDVELLVDRIYDQARYKPLLVVSCAADTSRPRVSMTRLQQAVEESVDIAVIAYARTAWTLTNLLPTGMRTYGGAIRLWWPYASREDAQDRHPAFITMTESSGPATIAAIRRMLTGYRYLDADPTADLIGAAPPLPQEDGVGVTQDGTGSGFAAPALVAHLTEETRAAQARASAAELEMNALRRQIRSLTDQVETLTAERYGQRVFDDPEEQFRHEVYLAWLNTLTPADRERYPLRTYTVGPDFLNSVETLEGVDRPKIVSTAVDVVTSRAWEINGRSAHQYREGPTGNAPTRVREDGAVAWRCSVQNNTPSARRLMWWELTDGTLELAKVCVHDDMSLR